MKILHETFLGGRFLLQLQLLLHLWGCKRKGTKLSVLSILQGFHQTETRGAYQYSLFFFQIHWDIIDIEHCVSLRCIMWWIDTCVYCEMSIIELANRPITSHNYFYVWMVKTFKIFSLSNFQVYNTVYSVLCYSRVTMSNNAVHLIPRTYLFKTEFVPFDQPQHTQVLATIFLISVSLSSVFSDSTYKWNNTIFVFSVWIISLSIMLSSSIQDVANSKICFFFFF